MPRDSPLVHFYVMLFCAGCFRMRYEFDDSFTLWFDLTMHLQGPFAIYVLYNCCLMLCIPRSEDILLFCKLCELMVISDQPIRWWVHSMYFSADRAQKSIFDSADRWSACKSIPSVQSVRTPGLEERSSELCQRLWRLWARFCATIELWGAFMPFCGLLCKHSLVVKLSSLISVDVTRNGVSLDKSWPNSETNSCG